MSSPGIRSPKTPRTLCLWKHPSASVRRSCTERHLQAFPLDTREAEPLGEIFPRWWKLSCIPALFALGLDFLFHGEWFCPCSLERIPPRGHARLPPIQQVKVNRLLSHDIAGHLSLCSFLFLAMTSLVELVAKDISKRIDNGIIALWPPFCFREVAQAGLAVRRAKCSEC